MEEPLGFFRIFGEITNKYGYEDRDQAVEYYNEPAHHQLIGNYGSGVGHYIEEPVNILSLSPLPRTISGVGWSWAIVTRSERVQLLQEPVIGVDLRSPCPARPGPE